MANPAIRHGPQCSSANASLLRGPIPFPAVSYILYADFQIFRDEKRSSRAARPLVAIAAIVAVAGVLTPFTGVLFIVDTNNMYKQRIRFSPFSPC